MLPLDRGLVRPLLQRPYATVTVFASKLPK
jgi:hypothetical protein